MVMEFAFSVRRWVTFTFIGWCSGITCILIFSSLFDFFGWSGFQSPLGIGMGLGVGFFQGRMVRGILPPWKWWVSIIIGLGIPFLLHDLAVLWGYAVGSSYSLPAGVALGGLTVSIFQFLIFKAITPKAARWIVIGMLGWMSAMLTVISIDYIKLVVHHNLALFFINLTMIFSGGIVLGLVTGKEMKRILIPAAGGRRP
jgi:hypothetical protein